MLICWGFNEGRSIENWIDFDFFGHQLSAHISTDIPELDYCGLIDGVRVPIPHFGCILSPAEFKSIQSNLEQNKISFVVKPQNRYKGKIGEQLTMFVLDFSGNPLEFKAFKNPDEIFK
jgi:uncharacterized protein